MPLQQNDKEISNLAKNYSKHWMLYKQKVFLNLDTYCSAGIYPSGTGIHSTSATFTWSLISLNSSPRFSPRIVTSVPPSRGPRSGVICRQVAIETLPSFPLNKKQHGELPHPPASQSLVQTNRKWRMTQQPIPSCTCRSQWLRDGVRGGRQREKLWVIWFSGIIGPLSVIAAKPACLWWIMISRTASWASRALPIAKTKPC